MSDKNMTLDEIRELDKKYYMNTFGERTPLCFTEGKGIELTATDGKVYKDFFAGIAVNDLLHQVCKICVFEHLRVLP